MTSPMMTSVPQTASGRAAPLITIGMPLYNNAATVERAVRSLLAQTVDDLVLIASDDGSRDDTAERVARIAQEDRRLVLVRQPRNLNYGNFRYVLSQAAGPYFMFAAGDDWWEPTFIERCLEALEAHPAAVCAVPRIRFYPPNGEPKVTLGTNPLTGTVERNLVAYFRAPHCNSRRYGLFRTEVAQRAFPATDHHAYDLTFSACTLLDGHHVEVPEVLMHRDHTPPSRYVEYVPRDATGVVARWLPLLPMSRALIGTRRFPRRLDVLRSLAQLNLQHHLAYTDRFHPGYRRSLGSLVHRVFWRL